MTDKIPLAYDHTHVANFDEYQKMYKESVDDPEAFWSKIAGNFHWDTPCTGKVLNYNFHRSKGPINIEWFKGGTTNICYNSLDRHLGTNADKTALIWEGNDGETSNTTFAELHALVCRFANVLKAKGVKKGDPVTLYMPMVIELPAAMLACARIGAVHSVVFGGFSAEALSGRILDSKTAVVVTTDGVMRGAKPITLKAITDDALERCAAAGFTVSTCIVTERLGAEKLPIKWVEGRDAWWHDLVAAASPECPCEWMDAEDPLFILYTSGSTGKPKGVMHTTAGYMIYASTTTKMSFDLRPDDTYWCTADCGWVTGHSYLTYGPLCNATTSLVFEGVPTYPDSGRVWQVVEKHKVNIVYTAPTLIRALMRFGDEPVKKYDRSTLRVLGTVGEPINPEAWRWYFEVIGESRCPIIDTWWQTETGGHMITPLPGLWDAKPGSASLPFFGVQPCVINPDTKEEFPDGPCSGHLCIKFPWPSTTRTVLGDHERYEEVYFSQYDGYYFTGDGCRRDEDGYYWLTGRVDDVINVSGHRIGTAEVESALVNHPSVSEAAVVGFPHEIKGEGIYAYVTLKEGVEYDAALKKELVTQIRTDIGAFAAADVIHWAPDLPKTRSGKIMRRILRKIADPDAYKAVTEDGASHMDVFGDTSTLAVPGVVDDLLASKGK